jgi:hypothetical protein
LYLETKRIEIDREIYSDKFNEGIYITHGSIMTVEILEIFKEDTANGKQQQQTEQQPTERKSDEQERRRETDCGRLPTEQTRKRLSTAATTIANTDKFIYEQLEVGLTAP